MQKSITPQDKKLSTTQQNFKFSSSGMGPPPKEESKQSNRDKADSKFNMFDSSQQEGSDDDSDVKVKPMDLIVSERVSFSLLLFSTNLKVTNENG